jgi:hypothetical protein
MDAFLENPQDWAYQKTAEANGAFVKDYANANMSPKQVTLSTIWGEHFQQCRSPIEFTIRYRAHFLIL